MLDDNAGRKYLIQHSAGSGKTFAVIADKAHSSQAGEAASKLKAVLSAAELGDG